MVRGSGSVLFSINTLKSQLHLKRVHHISLTQYHNMYVICIENGHCLKYLVQHLLLEKQRKDSHKINEKYFKINFVEAYFHLYEKKRPESLF